MMLSIRPGGLHPICLLLPFLLMAITLSAAASPSDSLRQVLERSEIGSRERGLALTDYAKSIMGNDPAGALPLAREAIALGEKLHDDEVIFQGCLVAGVTCVRTDRLLEALQLFLRSQEIARNKEGGQWALWRAKNGNNLTGIYWMQEDYEKALAVSRSIQPDVVATGDTNLLANWEHSISLFYRGIGEIDSAIMHCEAAIRLHTAVGNTRELRISRQSLAKTLIEAKRYREANDLLGPLLEEVRAARDTSNMVLVLPELAKARLGLDDKEHALRLSKEYASLSDHFTSRKENLISNELFYKIYRQQGRLDSALHHHELAYALKLGILEEERSSKLAELETAYAFREKELENAELQRRNALASRNNIIWASASILFFLLFTVSLRLYLRLKRTNQELEQLQVRAHETNGQLLSLINEKKHIIGLIAHDVRTPIYLIQMNARVLEKTLKSDAESLAAVSETRHAADQIHDAVLRIMEVENKHIGKDPEQSEVIDLRTTVERVCRDFRALADSKDLRIAQTSFPKPLRVKADPFLLRHAVYNLMSNAVKFSPNGRKIGVRMEEDHHLALIHICDEGPGLSPEQIERIHSGSPTQLKDGGKDLLSWGQGLYLTRKFLQEMGGALTVKSEPGKGSTFTITLPMAGSGGV